MNSIDPPCRISAKPINLVSGDIPNRTIAAPECINAAAVALGAKQRRETDIAALVTTAADVARQAKAELHNAVVALRESVQKHAEAGNDLNSD